MCTRRNNDFKNQRILYLTGPTNDLCLQTSVQACRALHLDISCTKKCSEDNGTEN